MDSFCSFQQTGAEGCCESNPVTWDFETPVNWSYTANAPPCGWQVISTSQAVEGSHVLYYGDPGAMNFDCGTNEGTATSEMVTLLPGVDYQLTFKLFQDTESGTTYDKLWMYVLVDGKKTTMWTKQNMSPGAMGSWTSYSFDVSGLAGKTVQFQWEFDSHDGVINDKLGVMVDAMKIISSCEAVSCTNDADCSDDISSTTGTCSPTGCTWSL